MAETAGNWRMVPASQGLYKQREMCFCVAQPLSQVYNEWTNKLKEIEAQHLTFLDMFSMKIALVWAWLLVANHFNEMPNVSSGFQPSKCSSTPWRPNGCHRPTSTGTALCISWCWENCDMLILNALVLLICAIVMKDSRTIMIFICASSPRWTYKDFYPSCTTPGKAKQTTTATDLKMMVHVPTLSWELFG